jgi:hypothetical protein
MENREILEQLKQSNEHLEEIAKSTEWTVDNTGDIWQVMNGMQDSKLITNQTNSFGLLSLIFGFLVGYFLVKSFFDSYRY